MPRKNSLLIVDDEVNVTRTLQMVFEQEGYRVFPAYSCAEAVAFLQNGASVDAIITDLNMEQPDIGLEVARIAKDLPTRPVVVICTGFADVNITGVHVANVKQLDLRPQAIQSSVKRSYFETSARMVKYYDSLRFVYEVESRLRELKQNVAPEEQKTRPPEKREKHEKNNKDMSNRPEQENQKYSQQMPGGLLEASLQPPLDSAIQPSLGCESRLRRTV